MDETTFKKQKKDKKKTCSFQMLPIPNVTGRRIAFPMGSYGAGSIKMTVFLSCMNGWARKYDSIRPKQTTLLFEALGNTSKIVFIAETNQYQAAQGMPDKDCSVIWNMTYTIRYMHITYQLEMHMASGTPIYACHITARDTHGFWNPDTL